MDKLALDFLSQQSGTTAALIGGAAVVIFVVVKIKKAVSAVWPFIRKFVTVVDDLFGAEARPGVEARPGLMARMKTSEEADARITATLSSHSETLKELQPNHGGSMKDVLNSVLERLGKVEGTLSDHIATQQDRPAAVVNVLS